MAEKMYGFTHLISETKLLALIASNADEVKVDIFVPERRGPKRLQQNGQQSGSNGHAPQLMLDAPAQHRTPRVDPKILQKMGAPRRSSAAALAKQWGVRKWSARTIALKMLYDNLDRPVTTTEINAEAARFGISPQAVSVALTPLVKDGMIERPSQGQYKLLAPGVEYVQERQANKPSQH